MYITIPMDEVEVIRDPMNFEVIIKLDSVDALDNLISRCRDIKLSIMEGEK